MKALPALLLLPLLWPLASCTQHLNAPEARVPVAEMRFRSHEVEDFTAVGVPHQLDAMVYTPISLGPFPTVVVVSSRGWAASNAHDARFVSEFLASRGFAVVAISHRSLSEAPFPAQLDDLREALRWVNSNAREYRLDVERLTLFGFESGGHLASLLAVTQSRGLSSAALGRHDASLPPIRAVISGGAPMDLGAMSGNGAVQRLLQQAAAHGAGPNQVSPLALLHDAVPPFFLFHGTTDGHVPVAQAQAMFDALNAQGTEVELYRMRLRGHTTSYLMMSGALESAANFLWQEVGDAQRYERRSP